MAHQSGVPEQSCEVCGKTYQPYRAPYVIKDGRVKSSRTCSRRCHRRLPEIAAVHAAWNAIPTNRERKNAARRIAVDPDRREKNLRSLLRRYGLSLEEYQARVAVQDGKCYLCGHTPNGRKAASRLSVDHDHATGAIRKLLCNGCNRGIGYLMDDPVLVRAAATYIESHRAG